ncbi:MAG: hypothetical protein ACFB03_11100 [Paracoccaceae bacterium]
MNKRKPVRNKSQDVMPVIDTKPVTVARNTEKVAKAKSVDDNGFTIVETQTGVVPGTFGLDDPLATI